MATTSIHQITQTIGTAIAYITSDKLEPSLREDVPSTVNYCVDGLTGEVTYKTLTSTLYCANPGKPQEDFERYAYYFGRDALEHGSVQAKDGRPILAWHLVQSFEGEVDPRIANEIGRKLAEELFVEHPTVVSTHTNTENTHNHIVISAWNADGMKWHNCHASYREIRNYSDRLCEEYGLKVLDKTRDHVLIQWKDKQGKIRYFEPTARKSQIREKRKYQKTYPDDAGSYRNTFQYEISEKRRDTNITIVKADIDEVIPYARSYDHFISLLLERGYVIRSKKKSGEWLKNVTFISPVVEKGVRDSTIGAGYSRERLTAVIEEQNRERDRCEQLQKKLNLPVYQAYCYGETDVQAINEDYRAYRVQDGSIRIEKRNEPEKVIICSIKESDRELYGLYDTTYIHRLLEEQRRAGKKKSTTQRRDEMLVRQIQEGFESLRFVESKGIRSCQEAEVETQRLRRLIEKGKEKLTKAESAINRLEQGDSISDYRDRLDNLRSKLDAANLELKGYEQCLSTMHRIEIEHVDDKTPSVQQLKRKANKGYER